METMRLRRDMKALLGDYIGQKLRENGFDPKGKGSTTMLDDLAHYDLAISVALWWLEKGEGHDVIDRDVVGVGSPGYNGQYPNLLEREAMILSSFAGMILNSLPVEDILALYSTKPSAAYLHQHSKSTIVHPFTLSYHPFAMLSSFKAVDHSRKHTQKLKWWLSVQGKGGAAPAVQRALVQSSSSSSSTSNTFLSVSGESLKEQTEHYEG
ncbi:uncharacterized protein C2orf80 [Salmo salar]|uniref:Uncharacterized protein C2orf80 n=1 Tax=Salmo salar TaxID=8030 RepID=A0A1S3NZR6_SALSA|nr:uncharacterized protein C2orf80-like [Salmo salar]|eukprot:XP_014020775.1 PREDICTED: uncharacterized protein C2orf80-like isoform X2 [Salmo salar]